MIVFSATEVYVDDYVTGGTGVVMIVNPTTLAYVSDISVQSSPGQMALDNNSSSAMYNRIAICNVSSNTISIINTATNTAATLSITGLTSPSGIIYIPSQDAFYVSSGTGKNLFKLVPTSSTTVTASIAIHNSIIAGASLLSYDWQHNYLIFQSATAVGTPAYLHLFNLTNNTVISTFPLIGNAVLDGLVAWDGNNQKWWAIRNQISGQSGFGSLTIIH